MNQKLILVKIDKNYCNYLRKFDSKVPYNFGKKETRPFIGVLFKVENCMYFAPLSSPKPKHIKMKSKIDFLKIDNGKLGVINFNNMLPVLNDNIEKIDLGKETKETEKKYLKLLKEQLYWLNRNNVKIYKKSERLYRKYICGKLDVKTASRCCNFKLLEEKCNLYKNKNIDTHDIIIKY